MSLVIYTSSSCPYCVKAKNLLDQLGLMYEERHLERGSDAFIELMKQTGMRTVPQILWHDELIGGCDDLFKLHESGKLLAKLGKQ